MSDKKYKALRKFAKAMNFSNEKPTQEYFTRYFPVSNKDEEAKSYQIVKPLRWGDNTYRRVYQDSK